MPTYVYETVPADGRPARRFEVSQRMSEPALVRDPQTGEAVRRVITGGLGLINVGADKNAVDCPPQGCGLPQCERPAHVHGPGCGH